MRGRRITDKRMQGSGKRSMSLGKVSIIVPVYNTEKYLQRCLSSIQNQSYKNIEIICIDDGSTDGSGEILDKLAAVDDRLVVIHQENMGVAKARNVGLQAATGDYIGFVDSDDYICKGMYHEMIGKLETENADIVTCGFYFDDGMRRWRAENLGDVPKSVVPIRDFLPYIYERDKYRGVAGYMWTRLFRRELIFDEKNKLRVSCPHLHTGEDIVFVAKVNMLAKTILYIDKPLYCYFQRDDSIGHTNQRQLEELAWVNAYEIIIRDYSEAGIEQGVINLIKRMHVYRCGKILEIALQNKDQEKITLLRKKIRENLQVYRETNLKHLERVRWIEGLLHENGTEQ